MPSRSNTAPKKRATGIRNKPCFPTLFFAREGRLLARPPHAETPPYKVHPRAALPTVELETKILGPLRGLKVCAKIQGVRFVYVGSLGQEPNWFAQPIPSSVSGACRRRFVSALASVRTELDMRIFPMCWFNKATTEFARAFPPG